VTCETPQKEESSLSISPPLYITNLNITYDYSGLPYLTWDRVQKRFDGSNSSIDHYEIYRSLSPNFLPDIKDKTNLAGTSTTTEYYDYEGGYDFYYKVVAIDQKGNPSPY
jgi:hypothetical protein